MAQRQNIDSAFTGPTNPTVRAHPDRRRARFASEPARAGSIIELSALPLDIQRTVQARIKLQTGRDHAAAKVRLITASNTPGATWQETDKKAQRSFTIRFFLAISPALLVIAALIVLA